MTPNQPTVTAPFSPRQVQWLHNRQRREEPYCCPQCGRRLVPHNSGMKCGLRECEGIITTVWEKDTIPCCLRCGGVERVPQEVPHPFFSSRTICGGCGMDEHIPKSVGVLDNEVKGHCGPIMENMVVLNTYPLAERWKKLEEAVDAVEVSDMSDEGNTTQDVTLKDVEEAKL